MGPRHGEGEILEPTGNLNCNPSVFQLVDSRCIDCTTLQRLHSHSAISLICLYIYIYILLLGTRVMTFKALEITSSK
jgi:hypothetical protein